MQKETAQMARFDGRSVLVTGGGRGIGAATSARFASEGAAVAVADLDQGPAEEVAGAIRDRGGRAIALSLDVTRRDQVEAAVARVTQEHGRLDVLVACAGLTRDNLVHKMGDEDWDLVIDTHLKGTFLCAQAAQRAMVPERYGKMVFLSSTSALGNPGQTNYSTAKAGLQGMARTLAIELGPFNINVNTVAPGFVETRMTQATAERMGLDYEQMKQMAADRTPLQRTGRPEDIAAVIAFLSSDDASFVTGQTIYARGGP
jgi:3-oxoacyl-[acyl-carrier protein] reductase